MKLEEIEKRLTEIRSAIDVEGADITALTTETNELIEARNAITAKEELRKKVEIDFNAGKSENKLDSAGKDAGKEARAALGDDLRTEKRQVALPMTQYSERVAVVGVGEVILPTTFASNLNDTFEQVSSLVDLVPAIPLNGGEAYEKGFVKSYGEGAITAEDAESHDVTMDNDKVSIGKALITSYQKYPRMIDQLANANYSSYILKNVSTSVKKVIAKEILTGDGTANHFTGILNTSASNKCVLTSDDIEIAAIDADTLDKLVFGFPGDEDIMVGMPTLILNKSTLQAFATTKTDDGRPVYSIEKTSGGVGYISKAFGSGNASNLRTAYVINSNIKGLAAASAGDYVLAYGYLGAYEMPVFTDLLVERSEDSNFKTREIAYRAETRMGGNVATYRAFIRAKKVVA